MVSITFILRQEAVMTKSTRMLIMDRKIIVRLIEGDSFNLIARELKVGKRRIKRIYTKAFGAGYLVTVRERKIFSYFK